MGNAEDLDLEVGRINLPFGVYYSHFVSGPLIELGETRGDAAVLTYEPSDAISITGFVYDGPAKTVESTVLALDYGLAIEASPTEFFRFGLSYLSDLADSKENLLADASRKYREQVAGASVNFVLGNEDLELTAEALGATRSFENLNPDRNRPLAWNVELTYFPIDTMDLALRLERSDDLQDAPQAQGGFAIAWRISKSASITLEYLLGQFERGLANNRQEREIDYLHRFATQISFTF